jgi:hypothetical protein
MRGAIMSGLEFRKTLCLSTAHVTEHDLDILSRESEHYFTVADYDEGVFFYVPQDFDTEGRAAFVEYHKPSASLLKVIDFARAQGAEYVQLDRDGPIEERDELDVNDW